MHFSGRFEVIQSVRRETNPRYRFWHTDFLVMEKKRSTSTISSPVSSSKTEWDAKLIESTIKKQGKLQRILIQVKLSEEESKHGIAKKHLGNLFKAVATLKNLSLEGLMTMPPFFNEPEKARPYFQELRALRDKAEDSGLILPELSMGMTNDFEVAILEGATMVRIGTAIFGERR